MIEAVWVQRESSDGETESHWKRGHGAAYDALGMTSFFGSEKPAAKKSVRKATFTLKWDTDYIILDKHQI